MRVLANSALIIPGLIVSASLSAAEFSGYAVLTTDYVRRGVSQSDEHAAAQLGLDVTGEAGWYAGIWGSTVDINNSPVSQRDVEVNYYAGFLKQFGEKWGAGANVVFYEYPGQQGLFDYSYTEYSANMSYDDRMWLEYSYSPDIFNSGQATHNIDVYAEQTFATHYVLGAGGGYWDVSRLAGQGYGYWQLGVTRPIGRVDIDLRYHDTNRHVPIFSTPERAQGRLVLSLRLSF